MTTSKLPHDNKCYAIARCLCLHWIDLLAYQEVKSKIQTGPPRDRLQQQYKGYTICGSRRPVHNDRGGYFAHASVLLIKPNMVCVQAYRDEDHLFRFDDEDEARLVGLFLAELAVDHFVPPPAYYLTPMNMAWAVDILRRTADEYKIREILRPKLYEALDFLEKSVEPTWLVKRYRRELSGDRRNERQKDQLREALRLATRGIQQACAA
jgi:hypothetical protein